MALTPSTARVKVLAESQVVGVLLAWLSGHWNVFWLLVLALKSSPDATPKEQVVIS